MKKHSYCSFHPSREAQLRCHRCERWLCDRCVQVLGDEVFCSRACHLRDLGSRSFGPLLPLLRRKLPTPWSVAVVAAAVVLLISAVGSHLATLLELSSTPVVQYSITTPTPGPTPSLRGSLYPHRGRWNVDVNGAPGATVLLLVDGKPQQTIELDETGHALVSGLRLGRRTPTVSLQELSRQVLVLEPGPTTTPTPTTSPSATPTPSPTPVAPAATAVGKLVPTVTAEATTTPSVTPASQAMATTAPKPTTPSATATQPVATAAPKATRSAAGEERGPAPPVLHLVSDAEATLALTFDGGSSSNGTARLLDLLRDLELQVTMFLTGTFIERNAALVRRAVLEGHEIGNHTYSHPHLTSYAKDRQHRLLPDVTRAMLQEELRHTEELFFSATGRHMAPYWRAPFGEENRTLRAWALEAGYLHVRWSSVRGASLDSWDWVDDEHSSLYQSPERIMERLLRFPRLNGGIVLMHMASDREQPPWLVLPELVQRLRDRQISPTTVTGLLESSATWRPWLDKARRQHQLAQGPEATRSPESPQKQE